MSDIVNGESATQGKASQAKVGIQTLEVRTKPIFIRTSKKKRRYSRGSKGLQQRVRGITRMSSRLLHAVADGMDVYRKRENRSSRKKKDGMLKDLMKNSAKGLSKTIRKSSKLPKDAVKVFFPRSQARRMRKATRSLFRW